MRRISSERVKAIIERHKHWLNKDCDGWEEMKADLSDADLHYKQAGNSIVKDGLKAIFRQMI